MVDFNLYCPVNNLGYGVVARSLIKELSVKSNNSFHLSIIGQPQLDDRAELQNITHLTGNLWNRAAPSVAIWHEFDLNKFSSNKLIAFPIFETTRFNLPAINYLKQMDAVFVMSKWAKDIVHQNIGENIPVFVVPGAADVSDALDIAKNKTFTFFTVGKFESRKSHAELIAAYANTFANSTHETRLICHIFNPFIKDFTEVITKLLTQLGLTVLSNSTISATCIVAVKGNAIVEIPKRVLLRSQVLQLYKYCHVGVFPSKAEGWNLPLMEAIQLGTPCIATNYSAHTEYLTSEFDYPQDLLLNKTQLITANDGVYFKGDRGEWAAIDMNELKEKLLYSCTNYNSIVKTFDNTKIKETFTWNKSADKFLAALKNI
jgi:glycosyltransferase involved in cell wall biosynthesis